VMNQVGTHIYLILSKKIIAVLLQSTKIMLHFSIKIGLITSRLSPNRIV
jgi:hypothetical protein